MVAIYKYHLSANGVVEVPVGAKLRKIGRQGDNRVIWCEVDTYTLWTERWQFHVFGTGDEIRYPQELKYVDTIFEDPFVWHVYKERKHG